MHIDDLVLGVSNLFKCSYVATKITHAFFKEMDFIGMVIIISFDYNSLDLEYVSSVWNNISS